MAPSSCFRPDHWGCWRCEGPYAVNREAYDAVNLAKPKIARKRRRDAALRLRQGIYADYSFTPVVGYLGKGRAVHPVTYARLAASGNLDDRMMDAGITSRYFGYYQPDYGGLTVDRDQLRAVQSRLRVRRYQSASFVRDTPPLRFVHGHGKRGGLTYWQIVNHKLVEFDAPFTFVSFCEKCRSPAPVNFGRVCDHCCRVDRAVAEAKKLVNEADKVRLEIYRHLRDNKPQAIGA